MTDQHEAGTQVKWKWGEGWGRSKVKETFTEKVTKEFDGTEVTRNVTSENPAYLIEQEDGDKLLKSHSEIERDA